MNQDISPPNAYQTPQTQGSNPEFTPETPGQQPAPQVIQAQSGPKKSKAKAIALALVFLLLLGAVAGAYLYQQGKVDAATTAQTAANSKIVSLQSQLSDARSKATTTKTTTTTTPAVSYDVVTGDATPGAVGLATLHGLHKAGTVTDIWVEYGTAPDKLTSTTTHVTKGLGEGSADSYTEETFNVTGLASGKVYFYRVAATEKGAPVYGGVASFTATK